MSEELLQMARRQVEAFNEGDWDALRELLVPDAVYDEPATGRRIQGHDAIIEVNQGWKAAFPDAIGTINDIFAAGDKAAVEITWNGTHSGTLALPDGGGIPPTGRPISVEACQIVTARAGKLAEARHFFDMLGMLEQLGTVSPEALAEADS